MLDLFMKNWKLRLWCFLFHFFHVICKICEPENVWRKLLVLSWLYTLRAEIIRKFRCFWSNWGHHIFFRGLLTLQEIILTYLKLYFLVHKFFLRSVKNQIASKPQNLLIVPTNLTSIIPYYVPNWFHQRHFEQNYLTIFHPFLQIYLLILFFIYFYTYTQSFESSYRSWSRAKSRGSYLLSISSAFRHFYLLLDLQYFLISNLKYVQSTLLIRNGLIKNKLE